MTTSRNWGGGTSVLSSVDCNRGSQVHHNVVLRHPWQRMHVYIDVCVCVAVSICGLVVIAAEMFHQVSGREVCVVEERVCFTVGLPRLPTLIHSRPCRQ